MIKKLIKRIGIWNIFNIISALMVIIISIYLLCSNAFCAVNPYMKAAQEAKDEFIEEFIKYSGYCVSCKQKVILTDIKDYDKVRDSWDGLIGKKGISGKCIHCGHKIIINIKIYSPYDWDDYYHRIRREELEKEKSYWFKFFWIKL